MPATDLDLTWIADDPPVCAAVHERDHDPVPDSGVDLVAARVLLVHVLLVHVTDREWAWRTWSTRPSSAAGAEGRRQSHGPAARTDENGASRRDIVRTEVEGGWTMLVIDKVAR